MTTPRQTYVTSIGRRSDADYWQRMSSFCLGKAETAPTADRHAMWQRAASKCEDRLQLVNRNSFRSL